MVCVLIRNRTAVVFVEYYSDHVCKVKINQVKMLIIFFSIKFFILILQDIWMQGMDLRLLNATINRQQKNKV